MENERTMYGTPGQDTPYSTPVSTPRRVPYRMNPVKMIRQHVPVKILSAEDVDTNSQDSDSFSTSHSMNPMKTKRVRCTVQPITVHDDIENRNTSDTTDAMLVQQSGDTLFADKKEELSDKVRLKSIGSGDQPEKLSLNDEIRQIMCHSGGDAENVKLNVPQVETSGSQQKNADSVVPTDAFNVSSSVLKECSGNGQKSPFDVGILHETFAKENALDSYNFLPQTVINDSNLLNKSSEKSESRIEESLETKKEIQITQKLLDVAASSFHDISNLKVCEETNKKPKVVKNSEKTKRYLPYKKPVQNQENNTNASTGHKCDKKKFYDPSDIRKYMIKKKYERLAKEKEEKNKKAHELAALKRKTEVTKMFAHRSKIPLPANREENNAVKEASDNQNLFRKTAPPNVEAHLRITDNPQKAFKNKSASHSNHNNKNIPARTDSAFKKSHIVHFEAEHKSADSENRVKLDDFADIEETEKYFQKRFNDIVSVCAKEASKIVNAELQTKAEGYDQKSSKDLKLIENSTNDAHLPLSANLDELKFKNPYNFLNILKGKVNLTQDEKLPDHQECHEILITPVKQQKTSAKHNDAGKTHTIDRRRVNDESYIFKHLKSELKLSDLHLSAQQNLEILRTHPERISSHTFPIPDHDARRKSAKVSKNVDTKENMDTSLGLSGVHPLPSFKSSISTPLTEKNNQNMARVHDFWRNEKLLIQNEDDRIALGKTYTSEKHSETVDQSKSNLLEANQCSNSILHANSDSLVVQNTSFLLPQSVHLRTSTNCDINQSKLPTSDKLDLIFDTDLTSNICMDGEDLNLSQELTNYAPQMNSSFVLEELYDQMIKSEDEKLLQILMKIRQQKEALNKYLRTEVFALEIQKNEYRDNKDDVKIKTIKKKQRGILLKVTKSILELDKMKKSVIETVDRRKADLLKQKIAGKQKKIAPKQKSPASQTHAKQSDANNKTFLITKQMKTFFGISSSSCTSIVVENGREVETNVVKRNEQFNSGISDCVRRRSSIIVTSSKEKSGSPKDMATSPIPFNSGISIRLDLDPEKLMKLKNSLAHVEIHTIKSAQSNELMNADQSQIDQSGDNVIRVEDADSANDTGDGQETRSVKIKRPLSPVILPPSKKILQFRRMSSSSDLTLPSLNDTTTTDQSDIELRISSLQEQLRQRRLEAERLRREEKQLRKEKLRSREQSLIKQLAAYDEYIKKVSKMLTESSKLCEVRKPLIKQQSSHSKLANDSAVLYDQPPASADRSFESPVRESYSLALRQREKVIDEGETNTEDSEKQQLRKADSGILIESEVTEPSETAADAEAAAKAARIETNRGEFFAHLAEVAGTRGDEVAAAARPVKTDAAVDKTDVTGEAASPSQNLLRTINDLQSEVNSLSEHLYSSDFVEEAPEEMAGIKSVAASDDNTSVSIDEILSDRHSPEPSDRDAATPSNERPASAVSALQPQMDDSGDADEQRPLQPETDDEKTPRTDSSSSVLNKRDAVDESSSPNASDSQSEFNIRVQTIENLESSSRSEEEKVDGAAAGQRLDSVSPHPLNEVAAVPVEEVNFDATAADEANFGSAAVATRTESSSDGGVYFFNVRNVSEIESLDELVDDDGHNNWQSEGDVSTQTNKSIVEDVKSASSLENLGSTKFEASDENESKTSPELIKLDYVNESEGSDVADVNEAVQPFYEVATMMDGANISISELSDVIQRPSSTDDAEREYENVVTSVRSYFDANGSLDDSSTNEPHADDYVSGVVVAADVLPTDKNVELPTAVPELRLDSNVTTTVDVNLEETDISESLEYDAIPVGIHDDTIPSIMEDERMKSTLFEPLSVSAERRSVNASTKKSAPEVSHEKDRSDEEHLVEDFSIPNLMGTTFWVHETSSLSNADKGDETEGAESVLSPVAEKSEEPNSKHADVRISDVDLEQITENQTPFLRALKREQENLLARRQESVEKITADLFDALIEETCSNLVSTISCKMRSCDFGIPSTYDNTVVDEVPDIPSKVNESIDAKKSVTEFDDNWFEKRLNFDEERLREAEELRLQQLKIEQEIEELQAQQHIPPYIYLREIPNKPPPPYTPPADLSLKIPSNEIELHDFVNSTIKYVCAELHQGKDIGDIKQLPETKSKISNKSNREISTYKKFLFDLTKEIAKNILEDTKKLECLPWDEFSKQKVPKPMPSQDELQRTIENEINVLFGFKSKIGKEKLIIQWSRKRKSDFVDDLLIQELQEEENEWTNYEKDELTIKNQITENLLEDLIENTAFSLKHAFKEKEFE